MNPRIKYASIIGIVSFFFFQSHFLLSEFVFTHWQNPKGENTLNFNIFGVYSSFFFALIIGFISFFIIGFIYKFIHNLISHIQEESPSSYIHKIPTNSDEYSLYQSIKLSLLGADSPIKSEHFENKFDWAMAKSSSINRVIPDIKIPKISGFDIAVFPSVMRYVGSDYIRLHKTKDGMIGILAGHMEPGILESAERVFIHGVTTGIPFNSISSEDSVSILEEHLHQFDFSGLKISIFSLTEGSDSMKFLHFMDMPIFQFSNHGIQIIEGNGDDRWHALHDHTPSIADGIEVGDFLVWASDRSLTEFGMTSFEIMEEFVDYLLDLSPKSAREMLLAIAKKMSSLGKERNLINPMEKLSILVVRKTR